MFIKNVVSVHEFDNKTDLVVIVEAFNKIFADFREFRTVDDSSICLHSPWDSFRPLIITILKSIKTRPNTLLRNCQRMELKMKLKVAKLLAHIETARELFFVVSEQEYRQSEEFFEELLNDIVIKTRSPEILEGQVEILVILYGSCHYDTLADNLANKLRIVLESCIRLCPRFTMYRGHIIVNINGLLARSHRIYSMIPNSSILIKSYISHSIKYVLEYKIPSDSRMFILSQLFGLLNQMSFESIFVVFQSMNARKINANPEELGHSCFVFELLSNEWVIALLSNQTKESIIRKIDLGVALCYSVLRFDDLKKSKDPKDQNDIVRRTKNYIISEMIDFGFKIIFTGFKDVRSLQ